MRIISAEETRNALTISEASEGIAATYAALTTGQVTSSSPSAMRILPGPQRIQIKGAVLSHEGIAGARLSSARDPHLILWNMDTAAPFLLLEESWLYPFRTGVSGAVVARWLSPSPHPRIALVGAGKIAAHMARGFIELCNPASIRIVAREQQSAERLINEIGDQEVDLAAAASVEEAVRDADIVATITTAKEPIVAPSWIKPGAAILSMGGSQEFEPAAWHSSSHRFVDDLDYALYQGDLSAWSQSGAVSEDEIRSGVVSIGEVAAGRWTGREKETDGVYAAIQGLTALDLALAHRIFTQHTG